MRRDALPSAPPRPHDLLWLADAAALVLDGECPAWATPAWLSTAPAVVRREQASHTNLIPVGLRGSTRSQRCAAWVPASQVLRVMTPEQAVSAWLLNDPAVARDRPCLQTLAALAPALSALPLTWGVTGGVGFTLASGVDVLRPDSDLDLLLRSASPDDAGALRQVAALLPGQATRVDVQVQTAAGAFALQEWMRTGGPVLLKTDDGPVLCDDPWRPEARMIAA